MTPLLLAARACLGLEPGILLRLRAIRPAECVYAGIEPGDVRIALDFDLRALPRLGVECMLPVQWFTVPAREWAAALVAAASAVPMASAPPSKRRRARSESARA